ncbi:MAG: ATP-binding cassette domain-containing protein, partial [Aquihabitans sp.]
LLATETTLVDGTGPGLPATGPLSVELRDVTFGYGTGHPVLAAVDLMVPAGTSVGIVGRTGSGKTTIGRLVARLWDTEQGAVLVGGLDVRTLTQADLRGRIGIVTQEVELFRATLRENLTLFGTIDAHDRDLERALDSAGLDGWLRSLPNGLDHHLDGDAEVSAGEGQLLAFARVLLADPAVVILDEASSRLDPATEARLADATDRLLEGRTVLIIAHRLATLDRVDSICVIDHGRVVEHGAREALAAQTTSRYHALVAAGLTAETGGRLPVTQTSPLARR